MLRTLVARYQRLINPINFLHPRCCSELYDTQHTLLQGHAKVPRWSNFYPARSRPNGMCHIVCAVCTEREKGLLSENVSSREALRKRVVSRCGTASLWLRSTQVCAGWAGVSEIFSSIKKNQLHAQLTACPELELATATLPNTLERFAAAVWYRGFFGEIKGQKITHWVCQILFIFFPIFLWCSCKWRAIIATYLERWLRTHEAITFSGVHHYRISQLEMKVHRKDLLLGNDWQFYAFVQLYFYILFI